MYMVWVSPPKVLETAPSIHFLVYQERNLKFGTNLWRKMVCSLSPTHIFLFLPGNAGCTV